MLDHPNLMCIWNGITGVVPCILYQIQHLFQQTDSSDPHLM